MRVDLSAEADAQVEKIDLWWRANRLSAPHLFTVELSSALAALSESPNLGMVYRSGEPEIRRFLLKRTHYHLYFVKEAERILVVAVWSAFRGRAPRPAR